MSTNGPRVVCSACGESMTHLWLAPLCPGCRATLYADEAATSDAARTLVRRWWLMSERERRVARVNLPLGTVELLP